MFRQRQKSGHPHWHFGNTKREFDDIAQLWPSLTSQHRPSACVLPNPCGVSACREAIGQERCPGQGPGAVVASRATLDVPSRLCQFREYGETMVEPQELQPLLVMEGASLKRDG